MYRMANYRPILILLGICVILIGGLSVWSTQGNTTPKEQKLIEEAAPIESPLTPVEQEITQPDITNTMNPIAVLETNKGTIEIELFKDTMPITAGNFEKLVNEGFYNGIKFHRVIDGFMIQSGDPITKTEEVARYGTGGPGYAIADEHIKGDLLTNTRGTISMANSGPNSGGSQFFINLVDNTNLDFDKPPFTSKHPVFGRVVKGMDIVDAIGAAATNERDLPLEPITIQKATIVTPS
jgi:peptidylprolyl isomerase